MFLSLKYIFLTVFSICIWNTSVRSQEIYPLKGGYELSVEISPDSSVIFMLKQGTSEQVIEEDYVDDDSEKFALRYSGMDFEHYFVLNRWESAYKVAIWLYEKSTGKNLFKEKQYYESCYDLPSNLLLYLDSDENANPEGNLTLLDLNDLSSTTVGIRLFTPENPPEMYYWADFEISKVIDDQVYITYNEANKQGVTHKFRRKHNASPGDKMDHLKKGLNQ